MLAVLHGLEVRRERDNGFALKIGSLTLGEGEYVAVTGPSGCGKSTTLDLLGMILRPARADEFKFNFGGREHDIARLWDQKKLDKLAALRRDNIGYVLQTGELLPFLSVEQNIELTAELTSLPNARARACELMDRLEIGHLARSLPDAISVGERQRAAIARALAPSPRLLLADEPTASLDPVLSRSVMRLFLETAMLTSTTILMVSHDVELVHEFEFREVRVTSQKIDNTVVSILDDSEDSH